MKAASVAFYLPQLPTFPGRVKDATKGKPDGQF